MTTDCLLHQGYFHGQIFAFVTEQRRMINDLLASIAETHANEAAADLALREEMARAAVPRCMQSLTASAPATAKLRVPLFSATASSSAASSPLAVPLSFGSSPSAAVPSASISAITSGSSPSSAVPSASISAITSGSSPSAAAPSAGVPAAVAAHGATETISCAMSGGIVRRVRMTDALKRHAVSRNASDDEMETASMESSAWSQPTDGH